MMAAAAIQSGHARHGISAPAKALAKVAPPSVNLLGRRPIIPSSDRGGLDMNRRNVYRTELTLLSFLERSAYVFPDKVAVIHGTRRYSYRAASRSACTGSRPRSARPA